MLNFSVAIPTFNGEKRLPQLLKRLRSQVNIENLTWEIIVVDNNSRDCTAKVIQDYQSNWSNSIELKYVLEPQQGAAFSRLRAIREAKGELVGFLDDDCFPASNWIAQAYNFLQNHPNAGAVSGQIHGEFEVPPPENFDRIQQFLAIREHGNQPYRFNADCLQLPPGASAIVRRQAWLDSVPSKPKLTGKLPGLFIQGDDYEPLLYLHKAGWEIWYDPDLHAYHQIPRWRFERDYLLSLARGCGLATCSLRFIVAKSWQKPAIAIQTILGNFKRIVKHRMLYGKRLQTDTIAAFELEFFWGSLLSPFYTVKINRQHRS
jgi:glycosyltransferase involved in cell wall biosynthesis